MQVVQRLLVAAAVSILAPGLAAVSAQAPPDSVPEGVTAESMAEGYELFQGASCRSCHGDQGRGGPNAPNLRDLEWLHSEGDFEGIFQTIRWGVSRDEIKAVAPRPWEMRPRGGMLFDTPKMRAIAAYLWGQANHLWEPSEADLFVDRIFSRGMHDAMDGMAAADLPVEPDRLHGIGRDLYNRGRREDGRLALEVNVERAPGHANSWSALAQIAMVEERPEDARRAAERALELDPENQPAQGVLDRLGGSG